MLTGYGVGSVLGGFLLEPLGIRNTFRMMAVVCGVTCVAYFLANRFLFSRLHCPSLDDPHGQEGKDLPNPDGQIRGRDVGGKKEQETEMTRGEGQEKVVEEVEGQGIVVERKDGQEEKVQESEGQRRGMDRRQGQDKVEEESEGQENGMESSEGQEKEVVGSKGHDTMVKGKDNTMTVYERQDTDEVTVDEIHHGGVSDENKNIKDSRQKDRGSGVKGNVKSSNREKDESELGKAQENLAFEDDE